MIPLSKLKTMRIGVLCGGLSSEREVSINTGGAVTRALKEAGYTVTSIDVGKDVAQK